MKRNNRLSPLLLASSTGNVQSVKRLLEHKADPNQRNNQGLTALMFALHLDDASTQETIVGLLIEHGADVNLTDCNGYSALQIASAKQNVRILKKLFDSGADMT
ncbi:hypothetical protein CAPTEDRAFT_131674, partial [Capitella teleta]